MPAFAKTFAELTLFATETPGIGRRDIARAADLVSHAALGYTPNQLATQFLGFVFSPTLPASEPLDDMIVTAAEALASSVVSSGAEPSNSIEATRILLIAISKKADLADATRRAIDAIEINKTTSYYEGDFDMREPIELRTPAGTVFLDRFEDRNLGSLGYRIAFRSIEKGGPKIGLTERLYETPHDAKDALKRLFTPQGVSKSAAA